MSADDAFLGDYGVALVVTLSTAAGVIDLTSVLAVEFTFTRPDGTTLAVAASVLSPATAGVVRYVFEPGDLNQAGLWRYQGRITGPGYSLGTTVGKFRVGAD